MNYDEEIKSLELKCQLESQQSALTRVDLESLRLRKKLEDYEKTRESLLNEIEITKQKIKGGN